MAIISENEARLAASIVKTWCTHEKCEECFMKDDCRKGEMPIDWGVPYIRSSDGSEYQAVKKGKE